MPADPAELLRNFKKSCGMLRHELPIVPKYFQADSNKGSRRFPRTPDDSNRCRETPMDSVGLLRTARDSGPPCIPTNSSTCKAILWILANSSGDRWVPQNALVFLRIPQDFAGFLWCSQGSSECPRHFRDPTSPQVKDPQGFLGIPRDPSVFLRIPQDS